MRTASAAIAIMIVRIRNRTRRIRPLHRQPSAGVASQTVTIGDRPCRRRVETSPTRSSVSNPREAENRERPDSAQPPNTSSKSANRFQPAKTQQTHATWSDFPGGRGPPTPWGRPVERPALRSGLRLREIQHGDRRFATRLPRGRQQPGQLGRMEAPSGRVVGDSQSLGDVRQAPTQSTTFEPEPAAVEPIRHRDLETGPGEPTRRRNPGIGNRPLDEQVSRPMAGRPSLTLRVSNQLGR